MEIRQYSKPYHTDDSIIYSCQYHVVWCPKYRRKVLTGAVEPRLKELILGKQEEYGYQVINLEAVSYTHLDVYKRQALCATSCW